MQVRVLLCRFRRQIGKLEKPRYSKQDVLSIGAYPSGREHGFDPWWGGSIPPAPVQYNPTLTLLKLTNEETVKAG